MAVFAMRFALVAVTPLTEHVPGIIGSCANEQVSGIAARRHVAPMTYKHPIRDGTERILPRYSVDVLLPAAPPDKSIATAIACALP